MGIKGDIYLSVYGGATTGSPSLLDAEGRQFSLGTLELSRKTRTASFRLVKDFVNKKTKLTLTYSLIDKTTLDIFEAFYNYDSELQITVFNTAVDYDDYIVLMDTFNRTRFRLGADGLWRNVTFKFEEV